MYKKKKARVEYGSPKINNNANNIEENVPKLYKLILNIVLNTFFNFNNWVDRRDVLISKFPIKSNSR